MILCLLLATCGLSNQHTIDIELLGEVYVHEAEKEADSYNRDPSDPDEQS